MRPHLGPQLVADQDRFQAGALRIIRSFDFEQLCGCVRAMATCKRYQGQAYVTPELVGINVMNWFDAGEPHIWTRVDQWLEKKAQHGGRAP
jgi:hypothetical protein